MQFATAPQFMNQSDVFIQWKGTDICVDFHCYACDTFAHYDGYFAYVLKCPTCGALYELPTVFALKPIAETKQPTQTPDGIESLKSMGWDAPTPLGVCTYHSDKYPDDK